MFIYQVGLVKSLGLNMAAVVSKGDNRLIHSLHVIHIFNILKHNKFKLLINIVINQLANLGLYFEGRIFIFPLVLWWFVTRLSQLGLGR